MLLLGPNVSLSQHQQGSVEISHPTRAKLQNLGSEGHAPRLFSVSVLFKKLQVRPIFQPFQQPYMKATKARASVSSTCQGPGRVPGPPAPQSCPPGGAPETRRPLRARPGLVRPPPPARPRLSPARGPTATVGAGHSGAAGGSRLAGGDELRNGSRSSHLATSGSGTAAAADVSGRDVSARRAPQPRPGRCPARPRPRPAGAQSLAARPWSRLSPRPLAHLPAPRAVAAPGRRPGPFCLSSS